MKDYTWLAVFSVFTLVVGALFTYGNATRADSDTQPIQVFITSTTTPSAPVIIEERSATVQAAPPVITVNVTIATSSFATTEQIAAKPAARESSPRTYYVTNNTTYTTQETDTASTTAEDVDAVTLTIQGLYDATTTPIVVGETLLEFLTRLDAIDANLDLATQDYGDMGILVTSMGGHTNGTDGNYWQYQVNGAVPMVGADKYTLQDGETILWEFKGF